MVISKGIFTLNNNNIERNKGITQMLSPACTFILNINVFWILQDPTLIYTWQCLNKEAVVTE